MWNMTLTNGTARYGPPPKVPCSGARAATATEDLRGRTGRAAIDHRVCSRVDGRALSPAISWQDRRNAAGWIAWHRRPRAYANSPVCRFRRTTEPPKSDGAWTTCPRPARRRAGELLTAPLATYLALHLGGKRAPDAGRRCGQCRSNAAFRFAATGLVRGTLIVLCPRARLVARLHRHTRGLGDSSPGRVEIPLRAVTGDQSAVPYASGNPDSATVYVNLGTGAFIQRPLQSRPPSPAPLLGSVLSRDADGSDLFPEGTVNGAGSAVSWFCAHESCDEQAMWRPSRLPDGLELPIFLNGIGGLGSPWWRVAQDSRFVDAAQRARQAQPPVAKRHSCCGSQRWWRASPL